jgi:3',5'-nucleoside bisphosphate phosphatase
MLWCRTASTTVATATAAATARQPIVISERFELISLSLSSVLDSKANLTSAVKRVEVVTARCESVDGGTEPPSRAERARMATKQNPLLCELHAHTTWSDGSLSVRDVCDLYGRHGFDVLAITDHTTVDGHIQKQSFAAYLDEVEEEAERARRLYDLLVLPGLELTFEPPEAAAAGHVVALGLRAFAGVGDGLEQSVRGARAHGAALVAAHPYALDDAEHAARRTAAFAAEPERWATLVDRFELFNRTTLFSWVAEAGLPAVATGDFHVPSHLSTWKTMLPCAKEEEAVVEYLRSSRPAYLVRLVGTPQLLAA